MVARESLVPKIISDMGGWRDSVSTFEDFREQAMMRSMDMMTDRGTYSGIYAYSPAPLFRRTGASAAAPATDMNRIRLYQACLTKVPQTVQLPPGASGE